MARLVNENPGFKEVMNLESTDDRWNVGKVSRQH
jgi:hypothetical protein